MTNIFDENDYTQARIKALEEKVIELFVTILKDRSFIHDNRWPFRFHDHSSDAEEAFEYLLNKKVIVLDSDDNHLFMFTGNYCDIQPTV